MIIQVVKLYIDYSKNNTVPPILCGFDESHGIVYPNIDENDNIFLYCLACDYNNLLGLEHYTMMELLVKHVHEDSSSPL